MTVRAETVKSHPIWAQLDAVDSALSLAAESKATAETAKPELTRVRKAVARVRLLLEVVDPDLVNINDLTEPTNHLTNVASWVNACASGTDVAQNIAAVVDQRPGWMSRLATAMPSPSGVPRALSAAAVLKRESEAATAELDIKLKALAAEIDAVRTDTAEVCASVTATGNDLDIVWSDVAQVTGELRAHTESEIAAALAEFKTHESAALTAIADSGATLLSQFGSSATVALGEGESILRRLRDPDRGPQVGPRVSRPETQTIRTPGFEVRRLER